MSTQYELNYLVMPKFVFKDNRLSKVAIKVYCFIHAYRSPQFFFSNEHLAEMFECSVQSISDAIQQLQELEYIKTTYQVKGLGGKTRFIEDFHEADKSLMTSRTSQKSLVGSEAPTSQKHLDNDTNDNNYNNNINDENSGGLETAVKMRQRQEARKARKVPFLSRPYYENPQTLYVRKPKVGVHLEDVR